MLSGGAPLGQDAGMLLGTHHLLRFPAKAGIRLPAVRAPEGWARLSPGSVVRKASNKLLDADRYHVAGVAAAVFVAGHHDAEIGERLAVALIGDEYRLGTEIGSKLA